MTAYEPWSEARAGEIIAQYHGLRGALLPMLHGLQRTFGYIDETAIPLLATELNLSKAEVHGVISFYHDFKRDRGGRHVIKICRAEACQSMGAEALLDHIKARLKVDLHQTTPDGEFSLEEVFCLGNCALSPAIMVDETLHGRVSASRFDAVVSSAKETGL